MLIKKNKMFFVNFNFGGYSYVYAKNLNEAKDKLLEKLGEKLYNEINWNNLISGKDAESLKAEYKKLYGN